MRRNVMAELGQGWLCGKGHDDGTGHSIRYMNGSGNCVACTRLREATEEWRTRKRTWHQKRTYGITDEEKLRIYQEQGGRCKRCGKQWKEPWGKDVHTDHHDDENGQPVVRGLLCGLCNTKLGVIEEYLYNLDGLKHATDQYLLGSASKVTV